MRLRILKDEKWWSHLQIEMGVALGTIEWHWRRFGEDGCDWGLGDWMEPSAKVNVDLFSIKFSVTLITASMAPIHFVWTLVALQSGFCAETFFETKNVAFCFFSFCFLSNPNISLRWNFILSLFSSFFCGISDTECPKCIPNFSAERIEVSVVCVCVSHVSKQLKCSKLMHNSSCNWNICWGIDRAWS